MAKYREWMRERVSRRLKARGADGEDVFRAVRRIVEDFKLSGLNGIRIGSW